MSSESKSESDDLLESAQDSEMGNRLSKRVFSSFFTSKATDEDVAKIRAETKEAETINIIISEPLLEIVSVRTKAFSDTSTDQSTQNARIRALSEKTGRSKDEVITAALTLYELGLKAQQHNKKFGVVEPDQQLITEVGSL